MFEAGRASRGVFILEALCGLVLIGVTLYAVSLLAASYERMQEHEYARRGLQLAAEGYIERLRAGGPPSLGVTHLEDAPPGVHVLVECTPGDGDWEGLDLVRVTATASLRHGAQVTYRLSGYVSRSHSSAEARIGDPSDHPPTDGEEARP